MIVEDQLTIESARFVKFLPTVSNFYRILLKHIKDDNYGWYRGQWARENQLGGRGATSLNS